MKLETKRRIVNYISYFGIAVMIILAIWLYRIGAFTNTHVLEQFVERAGIWGPLVFILIQIIQVVIPIIPGGISLAAGVVIFGAWWGFVYNYIGIILGSLILFGLGRRYGHKIIDIFVSEKTLDKYMDKLDSKGWRFTFALLIFLPVAPDDALVLLTALTKMSWKEFTLIILLGKPASIAAYSFALVYGADWLVKFLQ
ncbi:putative membrane protein YdjX (TVP38/TMEM64 family) [Weissella uvarum]|uniref:TVP38/TMEM64 family protein n=1 Tax=Weissella uvarum TaxID=1479233 RepID=UPI0019600C6A|nr:VTT domain-containing protein [Weissella uvarum]MBM7616938.1 putative membrane protein YdjX (TVP38/TMEM64 family) [Weissella uvarum]MCM0594613.1 TVP38/TMEM64 family protein [Weissella uvarum]